MKVAVPLAVNVDSAPRVTVDVATTAPDAVNVVVCTSTNAAAPAELTEANADPTDGRESESNLPIFACTFPVDAAERSRIPFMVSIPNTFT